MFKHVDLHGRPQLTRFLVYCLMDALMAQHRQGMSSTYAFAADSMNSNELPLYSCDSFEANGKRLLDWLLPISDC